VAPGRAEVRASFRPVVQFEKDARLHDAAYPGVVDFYGVVSQTEKVVEFFLERDAAEAMIGEVREDERVLAGICGSR
jgi:hypothetical protein